MMKSSPFRDLVKTPNGAQNRVSKIGNLPGDKAVLI